MGNANLAKNDPFAEPFHTVELLSERVNEPEVNPDQKVKTSHKVPRALLGLKVVTIRTEGWVFTFRP